MFFPRVQIFLSHVPFQKANYIKAESFQYRFSEKPAGKVFNTNWFDKTGYL